MIDEKLRKHAKILDSWQLTDVWSVRNQKHYNDFSTTSEVRLYKFLKRKEVFVIVNNLQ